MYKAKRISTVDDVTKYIYDYEGYPVEYTYIDNGTGKDILCIPSQTGCNLGCQFCFLTYRKDKSVKQIDSTFSFGVISEIIKEQRKPSNQTLLISFMGSGDALLCPNYVKELSLAVTDKWLRSVVFFDSGKLYTSVRCGVSTIAPSIKSVQAFTDTYMFAPVKLHWSLHHTDDNERLKYMPNAGKISDIAPLIADYRRITGNPVEVHYSLFDGNNSIETAKELAQLLGKYDLPVKLLKFRERPDHIIATPDNTNEFVKVLQDRGVKVEQYTPPGADVLSACGLFEVD